MATRFTQTVLVVDDEDILRSTIALSLERHGYRVLTAENGTDALEIIKSDLVNLVISDVRMPGGDGLTLLKEVQKLNHSFPNVILMTGYSEASEKECLYLGAKKVLYKPFDISTLLNSTHEVLSVG